MPRNRGEVEALRDWFEYNTYVRQRYLRLISRLPKAALAEDRGASFPSILDIFTHVLDVYKSWFHVYETGKDLPELKGLTLKQVKDLENEIDSYLARFMKRATAKDLHNRFEFAVEEGKKKRKIRRTLGEMLWHLVEEELQHRGELNALLWQDDIDPPVISWSEWLSQRKVKRK
jgi:uncharacterized damage-inducible protein DinB